MRTDDTILYQQFTAARNKAVELTDTYHATATDDPRRAMLWDDVVRQTELARGLLEDWLHADRKPLPLLTSTWPR